jgi:quinol-cytochrome oxidoreductase complex cytochrome b subunit
MAENVEEKKSFVTKARHWTNEYLTSVFAGLSPQNMREMFRGEPPGRPNPRYKVHNVSFWFHMKPRWYPKSVTKFSYTLALGWFSAFLAVVLGITGFILMFFYTPSTRLAYYDILNLVGNVPFGLLLRNLHRLGAELMVAIVMLHMLRVYFTGSYKQPRSFNWTVGLILLLVTWLFSYSGYLLPWDQLAYWAVTIGTSMVEAIPVVGTQLQQLLLGSASVGQSALIRFYALHVIILPLALIFLFGVHYHKVVRQGISKPPSVEAGEREDKKRIAFLPDIFSRETMWVMVVLLAMVVSVMTFFQAPLEDHADPNLTPLHSTAPWYFLWVQGLIKLPDIFGGIIEGKFIYGVIIPGLVIGLLFLVPYIDRNPSRRPQDRKLAIGIGIVAIILWVILTYMGTPAYKAQAPPAEEIALEFVPGDREGRIHEIPWEELEPGTYDTETFVAGAMQYPEHLEEFMVELGEAMEKELPGGVATFTIQPWQKELKRVDLDITWPEGGEEKTFHQNTYIHRNSAPQ